MRAWRLERCSKQEDFVGERRKEQPPYWLEVGDENWGPTDLRKRKPRSLPLPPPLPPVWMQEEVEPSKARLSWLRALAVAIAILSREDETLLIQALRGAITWATVMIVVALVVDWLK